MQIGFVAGTLGWAEVVVGQTGAGLGHLRESLELFDRTLDGPVLLNTLAITGLALARIGDVENGARLRGAGQLIGSPLMWASLEPTGLRWSTTWRMTWPVSCPKAQPCRVRKR